MSDSSSSWLGLSCAFVVAESFLLKGDNSKYHVWPWRSLPEPRSHVFPMVLILSPHCLIFFLAYHPLKLCCLLMWLFADFFSQYSMKTGNFLNLYSDTFLLSYLPYYWTCCLSNKRFSKLVPWGLVPSHSLLIDQNYLFPLDT